MHHQHVLSNIRTTCARFPNLVFAVAVSLPFALLILLALGLVWGTGQARAEGDPLITEPQDWAMGLGEGVDATPYGMPIEYESDVIRRNVPWLTADPISSKPRSPG